MSTESAPEYFHRPGSLIAKIMEDGVEVERIYAPHHPMYSTASMFAIGYIGENGERVMLDFDPPPKLPKRTTKRA